MSMKISIVTPSYNQADYIGTCLNSVAMQNYKNVEHIVVDGGSTDSTLAILDQHRALDARLNFTSGPDAGQGDAVNRGFTIATGDIVTWINSDDYYYDGKVFEDVVEIFASHPDVDVVYGGMLYVDADDNPTHVRIPPEFNYSLLTRIAYIGNTNTFYRRKVIERHLIDIDYHFVIDHEYMLRVTRDFKTMRTKRMIACFRVHPEAKTQTLSKHKKDIERTRRDNSLGIVKGLGYDVRQVLDRTIYKLMLYYTDGRYLSKCRDNRPYEVFLR